MGSNWKEYIKEAIRVLRFNGEMIISESIERYEIIKKYIEELGLHIKTSDFTTTNRWFYLNVLNDKIADIKIDIYILILKVVKASSRLKK